MFTHYILAKPDNVEDEQLPELKVYLFKVRAFKKLGAIEKAAALLEQVDKSLVVRYNFSSLNTKEVESMYEEQLMHTADTLAETNAISQFNKMNMVYEFYDGRLKSYLRDCSISQLQDTVEDVHKDYLQLVRNLFLTNKMDRTSIQYIIGVMADSLDDLSNIDENFDQLSEADTHEYLVGKIATYFKEIAGIFLVIRDNSSLQISDLMKLAEKYEAYFNHIDKG